MMTKLQEAFIERNVYTDQHKRNTTDSKVVYRAVFVNPEHVVSIRENVELSNMVKGKTFSTVETYKGVVHVVGSPEQVEEQMKTGKQLLNG